MNDNKDTKDTNNDDATASESEVGSMTGWESVVDFDRYKIHEGHIRSHVDAYTSKIISCELYELPEHMHARIVQIEAQIEKKDDGEWMLVTDAQKIYALGFNDGANEARRIVAENLFGIPNENGDSCGK